MAVDPTWDYVVELADARHALELHRLFFDYTRGVHQQRLLGEVRRLIDEGGLWLARERGSGHIVGACLVEPLRTLLCDDDTAEYGGAFVLPTHRRRGLELALTSVAIAHYFWEQEPAPLLAHVRVGDDARRALLHRAGFRAVGFRVPSPLGCVGVGAQGSDDDALVDAFVLHDKGRAAAFRRVASYLEQGSMNGDDGLPSPIYLEAHPEMTPQALRSAAALLCAEDDSVNAA